MTSPGAAGAVLAPVRAVLEAGLAEGVAPGLSAAVLYRGATVHATVHGDAQIVPERRPLGASDLFDVASLTKVIATGTLAALLAEEGALELDAPAGTWVAGFASGEKAAITLRHLLAHTSGLPAHRPYHERVAGDPAGAAAFLPPARRPAGAPLAAAFERGRVLVEELVAAEPLEAPPGARAVYSDLGFMALGWALARLGGATLDRLVETRVLAPLGLADTFFLDDAQPDAAARRRAGRSFVATERCVHRSEVNCGAVNDDNAWAMGGVAGHAGLFSTARDVAAHGQAWLDALAGRSRFLSSEIARSFTIRDTTPGTTRALAWDTPNAEGSTLGSRLGRGPRGAIGHLGFTGCSLWVDLDAELVCALLTNHVHPHGADKARMNALRRRFHDAVGEALGM